MDPSNANNLNQQNNPQFNPIQVQLDDLVDSVGASQETAALDQLELSDRHEIIVNTI